MRLRRQSDLEGGLEMKERGEKGMVRENCESGKDQSVEYQYELCIR